MKFVLRIYCIACGLLVGPACLAVLLALAMGVLPSERIKEALAVIRADVSKPAEASAEVKIEEGEELTNAPDELRSWERRLESIGSGVIRNVEDLRREIKRLQEHEERLERVKKSLAELLTLTLREPIVAEDVVARSEELVGRVDSLTNETTLIPKLLATLQTIEPGDLATILAGTEGSPGLDEEQSVRLLSEFPPRKAGAVLSEVGKLDPALAARIVAKLGGR